MNQTEQTSINLKNHTQWLGVGRFTLLLLAFTFAVKILLAGFFSSSYLDTLFFPFVQYFVTHFNDPWQHFFITDSTITFPYPPLMLYILTPFVGLIQLLQIKNIFWIHVILKLPIFLADLVIFWTLCRFRPQGKRAVIFYYFLSPIILLSAYMQGLLDIIPTALLLLAVFCLLRNRLLKANLSLAAALLCKSTAIVALPFFLIYIFRKYCFRTMGLSFLLILGIYLLVSLPFIFHTGYLQTVLNNPQQSFIFNSGYGIGDLQLFPVVLLTTAIVAHFFLYRKINNDLLLSYLNIAFSVFLIFAYPVPSWFIWITPFLTLFLTAHYERQKELAIFYVVFCLIYLIFFLFFYHYPAAYPLANLIFCNHPIFSTTINSPYLRDIVFTLLATMLAIQTYLSYRYSIRSNAVYKNRQHSLLLGISGDSGSGKSILLNDVSKLLGEERVTYLEGDGEHRWERGHENWNKHTHLDPKANLLHQQVEALLRLKQGLSIFRRDYDHHSGKFTDPKPVQARDYVVIAGLHPFYLPKARMIIDIKMYVDTDEKLRRHWKILRDKEKRGYSKEQVLASLAQRAADREKYIVPQRAFADVCFKYLTDDDFAEGDGAAHPEIKLLVTLSANVDLEETYRLFSHCETLRFNYDYSEDLHNQVIVFAGSISAEEIAAIANQTVEYIEELIGYEPFWQNDLQGIRQLMVLLIINHYLKEKNS